MALVNCDTKSMFHALRETVQGMEACLPTRGGAMASYLPGNAGVPSGNLIDLILSAPFATMPSGSGA